LQRSRGIRPRGSAQRAIRRAGGMSWALRDGPPCDFAPCDGSSGRCHAVDLQRLGDPAINARRIGYPAHDRRRPRQESALAPRTPPICRFWPSAVAAVQRLRSTRSTSIALVNESGLVAVWPAGARGRAARRALGDRPDRARDADVAGPGTRCAARPGVSRRSDVGRSPAGPPPQPQERAGHGSAPRQRSSSAARSEIARARHRRREDLPEREFVCAVSRCSGSAGVRMPTFLAVRRRARVRCGAPCH